MEQENKLTELKTQFNKTIVQRFVNWAELNDKEQTPENFVDFLIGCSIIEEKQIVRFMVVSSYPNFLDKHDGRRMRAYYSIEQIVPRGLTQIQSILKHYSKYFRYNKN